MSKDQDPEETSEEETEEETSEEEEESKEESEEGTPGKQSKKPDITLEETHKLAKAVQKGYTLTRQQIAKMATNQEAIQTALEELKKGKEETEFEEEEPLTVSKFLKLQKDQKAQAEAEDKKIKEKIDDALENLRAEGTVQSDDEEKDLLDYAVRHKITDLSRAAGQWREWYDAKAKSKKIKDKAKAEVRGEAGKKVGTSKKTTTEEGGGVDYNEIRNKSIEEIADEG